jgi:hypothetical protein
VVVTDLVELGVNPALTFCVLLRDGLPLRCADELLGSLAIFVLWMVFLTFYRGVLLYCKSKAYALGKKMFRDYLPSA